MTVFHTLAIKNIDEVLQFMIACDISEFGERIRAVRTSKGSGTNWIWLRMYGSHVISRRISLVMRALLVKKAGMALISMFTIH